MEEVWKPISGYEGLYEVSNLGRVRSLEFRNGSGIHRRVTIMSPTDNGHGYKIVGLSLNNKRRNHYVHRLVADAFIPNKDKLPVIDHIDHDRSNNIVTNLQWLTQRENVNRSRRLMSKPRKKPMTNTGERYISLQKNGMYRVTVFGRRIGVYKTLKEAITVRDDEIEKADRI